MNTTRMIYSFKILLLFFDKYHFKKVIKETKMVKNIEENEALYFFNSVLCVLHQERSGVVVCVRLVVCQAAGPLLCKPH